MCTLRGHKVAYPTPFEAVLRTERAVFPKFQAGGTLQGTGIVWTIDAYAFFVPYCSFCHDEGQSDRRLVCYRRWSSRGAVSSGVHALFRCN